MSGLNTKLARTREDKIFDAVNITLLSLFTLAVLYPLYFVVISSISDPAYVSAGKVLFVPKGITFEGYNRIFSDKSIILGYKNAVVYAVLHSVFGVFLTMTAGYAMSRKDFFGKGFFTVFLLITLYFNGGLIPTYLFINYLGWINTTWIMVALGAVNIFNIIVARTFIQSTISNELLEAANIDGCSHLKIFFMIILPLSKPIISIMILYYFVGKWNDWFAALIYLDDNKKYPLQLILRNILIVNAPSTEMTRDAQEYATQQRVTELLQYGIIIVASVPVLVMYPFVQKYFVKGVMIGSIKG